MTQETIEVGVRIVRELGVPVVLLAAVVYCFREAAIALHNHVLVPVVRSHTTFLDSTTQTLQTLGRAQERQADTLEELAHGQAAIQQAIVARNGAPPSRT